MGKLAYLLRSGLGQLAGERRACPNCGGSGAVVARKYGVTQLRRCRRCALLFRTPTDPPSLAERFYDEEYSQGQTTTLPSPGDLERMKANDFAELENDYAAFATILRSLGLGEGAKVFDYGCSWGYGSHLLRKAGFHVKSFEISRPRRSFGQQNLGIDLTDDFDAFVSQNAGGFDVFFCSHVLEHVPAPSLVIGQGLTLLRPGGLFVCVVPNGSQPYRAARPALWSQMWGEIHPNFLDDVFLGQCFDGMPYVMGTSPVIIGDRERRHLAEGTGELRLDALDRHELFAAARKPT